MSRGPLSKLLSCALVALPASAERWGVLVTGSHGWDNYRHHANVAHAYQRLIEGGVPRDNLIVMQYADVADDETHFNPYVGQLFNRATVQAPGVDVKQGLVPDYSGDEVTADAVLGVLQGTASGPVLGSGPDDDVVIAWAGHGGAGMLYMPDNSASNGLYADQLLAALKTMHSQGRYKRLLILLEACESGSMFDSADLESLNILAVTASTADENSYPEYCCDFFHPPSCTVGGQDVGTCLGDLFSVGWLEFADSMPSSATVADLIAAATERAKPVGGNPGNHVSVFGQKSLTQELVATFLGAVQSNGQLNVTGPLSPGTLPAAPAAEERRWAVIAAAAGVEGPGQRLPRTEEEFVCYREVNADVDRFCGGYSLPAGAKFARIVAEACAAGRRAEVQAAVRSTCGDDNAKVV